MWLASFGSMTAASQLTGARGQVLDKRIFFAPTLSFRLSFCYRFGLRFSYIFVYVEASMQCDKERTTRWAGSKWTAWLLASLPAWMCNSCSLAAGLLGSLVARQLSRLTAWQLYVYICMHIYICNMMYKFIMLCTLSFFSFLIVLPWFGHVFSNRGRFGHKRKLPVFFYNLTSRLLPADQWHVCESGARDVAIVKQRTFIYPGDFPTLSRLHSWSSA